MTQLEKGAVCKTAIEECDPLILLHIMKSTSTIIRALNEIDIEINKNSPAMDDYDGGRIAGLHKAKQILTELSDDE